MRRHLAITLLILLTLVGLPTRGSGAAVSALILYADWIVDGVQKSAEYGWSVASAGDVNGDGYDDVLIGAPKYTLSKEGQSFSLTATRKAWKSSPPGRRAAA